MRVFGDGIEINDIIEDTSINYADESLLNIDSIKLKIEINNLPDKYRKILEYRLQGYTMDKIGKILHYSQPQISRDYHKALNMLRDKFIGG